MDDFIKVPSEIREELKKEFLNKGINWLQDELKKHDPIYFETVDLNNQQRLLRALEVCVYTKKTYSSFLNKTKVPRNFNTIKILLNTSRENLYNRINNRVDEMMKKGLLEEAKSLIDFKELNALKTVGYQELIDHFEGHISLSEAVEKIKQHTRNYAKRQLTWFKNQDGFEIFMPEDYVKIIAYIDFRKQFNNKPLFYNL